MVQIRRQSDRSFSQKVRERLKKVIEKASYASRYHELRLKGKHPLRLLGTPKDPWTGTVAAGAHILSGRFYCQGQILRNPDHEDGKWQAQEIWQAAHLNSNATLNPLWQQHIHGFGWLRDLDRVVDRKAARHRAMDLVASWLQMFDQWDEQAWRPEVIGQRIINWMAYAPLIMDSNDLVYRSKLLNCLARQARHLYHVGDEELRALPRMQVIGGLILAGLYIPYGENWLKKGTGLLNRAVSQDIFADGGVSSRNPEELYRILRDFLMIRLSYRTMGHEIPDKLDAAIGRMTAMLKNLLQGDGRLSLFNGASGQDAKDIAATIALSEELYSEHPSSNGEKSGFRRLEQGSTILIQDTGPPADVGMSRHGHAGTLSFEMSVGKQRLIVNCGRGNALSGGVEADLHMLSRSTAAHSTLVLNDKNSSEIREDGLIGRAPSVVNSNLTIEKGHNLLETSHDGYLARFGLMHHRSIYMNETGCDIRGEDILEEQGNARKRVEGPVNFDVRFHIHPDITLSRQGGADRLLLRLSGTEFWQFQCSGGELSLEESLYMGAGGRRQNCRQIVISGPVIEAKTVIKWSLRRIESRD